MSSLMPELITLDIRSRRAWRSWLARHHTSSPGIWLVFHKGHTGVRSVPHEESVREALCFGWIDSLVKRLDDDRYAVKFTPRKPSSKWSAINRRRWAELKAEGALQPAGLAASPTENTYDPRPSIPQLPRYIASALKAHPKAWAFFQTLAAAASTTAPHSEALTPASWYNTPESKVPSRRPHAFAM